MSLRINLKLPPKPNEPDGHSEPAPGRRKKRSHLTVNSDEEDDYADSTRPGTQVNSDVESDEIANEPDSRFLHQSHSHPTSSSNNRQKRAKRKATPDSAPPTKRKRDISEQKSDDDYNVNDATPPEADIDDDDDFDAENKRHPKRARRTSSKASKGKGTTEASVKEGHNTSSTKTSAEASQPHSAAGSKRSRVRPLKLDDAGDAASSPSFSTHSPSPPRETSPPPTAKKRKLPHIKKNKPVGVPGASTPSNTSVPNKPIAVAGPPRQGLPEGPKSATVRKTPATAGNADFDLRNESVYRELFKPVSPKFEKRACYALSLICSCLDGRKHSAIWVESTGKR
jgi:hypothetical protein